MKWTRMLAAWIRPVALALSGSATATGLVSAQDHPTPTALCFRGRPVTRCRAFLITEFGAAKRLDTPVKEEDAEVTWELGFMTNLGPRSALGASAVALIGSDESGPRWGIRPRYRRWLGEGTTLDVSVGLLLRGVKERRDWNYQYPRMMAAVAAGFGDWVALTVQAEAQRYGCGSTLNGYCLQLGFATNRRLTGTVTDVAWHMGAKVASYPGAILGSVLTLAFIVALGAWASSYP